MIFRRFKSCRKILGGVIFSNIIATQNSQSVIWPKEGLYNRYFLENVLKMDGHEWLLLNSPRCDVIQFLKIKIYLGIPL